MTRHALPVLAVLAVSLQPAVAGPPSGPPPHPAFGERVSDRSLMVRWQMAARDITDRSVLSAMERVPRHAFVPEALWPHAYNDHPLPIGHEQTISQPYIVAFMTQVLRPAPGHRVLEIGTGSGYQAAVLAEIVKEVYTIEIVAPLARRARRDLERLGYRNIRYRTGDGYRGWNEAAPFDGIVVTAAPDHIPPRLVEQLKVGGRMVIPVGKSEQELLVIEKSPDGVLRKSVMAVRFVPMTGEASGTAPAPPPSPPAAPAKVPDQRPAR